jgi:hypothetical protein
VKRLAIGFLLLASCAHAAVWVPVRFIVAGTRKPIAIVARRWQAPGPWFTTFAWDQPNTTGEALKPPTPGVVDTAWLSVTQDNSMWRAGGAAVRLAAVWAPGDTSRYSNVQLIATGTPRDSALFDAGGSAWAQGLCRGWAQSQPNSFAPTISQATWVRAVGDTGLALLPGYAGLGTRGPIVHYQDLLTALPAQVRPGYLGFCMKGTR